MRLGRKLPCIEILPPARVNNQVFPTCKKSDSPEDPGNEIWEPHLRIRMEESGPGILMICKHPCLKSASTSSKTLPDLLCTNDCHGNQNGCTVFYQMLEDIVAPKNFAILEIYRHHHLVCATFEPENPPMRQLTLGIRRCGCVRRITVWPV